MAAVLKPSANIFELLESNDPGDTRLADLGAPAKANDAATLPVNINKKQQPQVSVWKANKLKAEANAAKNKPQKQPAAAPKAKAATASHAAGRNRKPAASKAQVTGTAANAGKNSKRPQQQQAAASKAQQAYTAATAATNKPFQFQQQQQQQQTPAPASLTQILFGNAYPSARVLIYKHRQEKLNALAKAKEGVAGGAPVDDKKGGKPNGAAVKDAPAPVQEEPAAPVKPVLPPPPPPSLEDSAQFPSLK